VYTQSLNNSADQNLILLFFQVNYDYRVTVMGLELTGDLIAKAEGLRLAVDLTADLSTYRTTLSNLKVLNAT
jgi:hypothetical protein